MYFFKKLDQYWGTFAKKIFFAPRKVKTLVKIYRIAKIGEKWLNDSEWLEMDSIFNILSPPWSKMKQDEVF